MGEPIQARIVNDPVNPGSLDTPGSLQFITSPADPDEVMGMLFRCPGGSGTLKVVSFTDYLDAGDDHRLGWNSDRRLPTVYGDIESGVGLWQLEAGDWLRVS